MQNKTYFVSRHPGSIAWIKQQPIHIDVFITHLDESITLNAGDTVIGSLPVHVIAGLNDQGVRFIHIQIDIPVELRGKELGVQEVTQLDVKLKEFLVWGFDTPMAIAST